MTISAATLAGGANNQDRYAYGDGWAFVLDGASSFAKTQPEHDGGWYAEHLKQALSTRLTDNPERTTFEIVKDAIREMAELHGGNADSCPTSTIALARWNHEAVAVYLLGDSTAALISADSEEVLTDARLADIAPTLRDEYRSRLSAGHGFDERHRELLAQLQARQAAARNRANGYWIAGADTPAALQGLQRSERLATLRHVVLATDGVAAGQTYGVFRSWDDLAEMDPNEVLRKVHDAEDGDACAMNWPRGKPHDDKTVIVLSVGEP